MVSPTIEDLFDSAYISLLHIACHLPELVLYPTRHIASIFALQIPHELTLQRRHTLAGFPFGRVAAIVCL